MIHQYRFGEYNIVLDTCSGAVHVVDDIAYDIIEKAYWINEKKVDVLDFGRNKGLFQNYLNSFHKK